MDGGGGIFVVLKRAAGQRPVVLCYTTQDFMAMDAVDEYAMVEFQRLAGGDWAPPATSSETSPLLLEDADWDAGAWPGGGRVEHEELAAVDGDFGSLVRIVPPGQAGGVEIYYTLATLYIKEDLLQVTPAMQDYEEAMRGGRMPIKRGGDLVVGALAQQATEAGLLPGADELSTRRRCAADFE